MTSLSSTCADLLQVSEILIAVACKKNKRMAFIERSSMDILPSSFELQSTETFYSVSEISMTEFGAKELEYESDFMYVVSVEGHSYILFVSYSYYSNQYSLSYIEIFIAKTEVI